MKRIKVLCIFMFVFLVAICLNNVQAIVAESNNIITVSPDGAGGVEGAGGQTTTIEDAMRNAADGGVIKLLSNITVTNDIQVPSKSLTLDLNGYKISYTPPIDDEHMTGTDYYEGSLFTIDGAEFVITDTSIAKTGEIALFSTSPDEGLQKPNIFEIESGKLTINGGKYTITTDENTETVFILCYEGTTIINNAEVTGPGFGVRALGGDITIYNANISATSCSISVIGDEAVSTTCNLIVHNGNYISNGPAIYLFGTEIVNATIKNGYFESKEENAISILGSGYIYGEINPNPANVSIRGGIFKGAINGYYSDSPTKTIKGGTFISTSDENRGAISVQMGEKWNIATNPFRDEVEGDTVGNDISAIDSLITGYTFDNITTQIVEYDVLADIEEGAFDRTEDDYYYLYYNETVAKEVTVIPVTQKQQLDSADKTVYIKGIFTGNPVLQIEPITTGNEDYEKILQKLDKGQTPKLAFEVTLTGGTFSGKATIVFNIDAKDGLNVKVYHLLKNGTIQIIPAVVKDKKIQVEVSELSPFVITTDGTYTIEGEKDASPDTGVETTYMPVLVYLSVVAMIAILMKEAKAGNK